MTSVYQQTGRVPHFIFSTYVHHAAGSYLLALYLDVPKEKADHLINYCNEKSGGGLQDVATSHEALKYGLWNAIAGPTPIHLRAADKNGADALDDAAETLGKMFGGNLDDIRMVDGTTVGSPTTTVTKLAPKAQMHVGEAAAYGYGPDDVRGSYTSTDPQPLAELLKFVAAAERGSGIENLIIGGRA